MHADFSLTLTLACAWWYPSLAVAEFPAVAVSSPGVAVYPAEEGSLRAAVSRVVVGFPHSD
jgi:hypothetical protein